MKLLRSPIQIEYYKEDLNSFRFSFNCYTYNDFYFTTLKNKNELNKDRKRKLVLTITINKRIFSLIIPYKHLGNKIR